ncbi:uncharacterized protein LOC142468858 [Ascaphus truei]|uniref:uncharacterized protein LOC142468858 n=1 Tax=Ascaphus truei TaxID=8439 RepID=UPI003F59F244
MTVKHIAATMCLLLGLSVSGSSKKPIDDPGVSTHQQVYQILQNYNKVLQSLAEIFSGIPRIGSAIHCSLNPGSSVTAAASDGPPLKSDSCDCDYHPGGCTISQLPPANLACYCTYKGAWTCGGEIRECPQPDAPKCKTPDKSLATCLQGGGDCGAYPERCDCDYHPGGCSIAATAVPNTACKCIYIGVWTCKGEIVRCKDSNHVKCLNPDSSRESCLQGGGDCDGY